MYMICTFVVYVITNQAHWKYFKVVLEAVGSSDIFMHDNALCMVQSYPWKNDCIQIVGALH